MQTISVAGAPAFVSTLAGGGLGASPPMEGALSSHLQASGPICFARHSSNSEGCEGSDALYYIQRCSSTKLQKLRRLDLDTGLIQDVTNFASNPTITALAATRDGDLYYTLGHSVCLMRMADEPEADGKPECATVAGQPATAGFNDAQGESARFSNPRSLAVDQKTGCVYIASQCTIRLMTAGGVVTTVAGAHRTQGHVDGAAEASRFSDIQHITLDTNGSLVIADTGNKRIRRLQNGRVQTVAGNGQAQHVDALATAAAFTNPTAVAAVKQWIYVLDQYCIRCISPDGSVVTIAGKANGYVDGLGDDARLCALQNSPLVVDGEGRFVFVDAVSNTRLRQFRATVHKPLPQQESTFLQDIAALVHDKKRGGDVTFVCDNAAVMYGCSAVLKTRSSYFRELLKAGERKGNHKISRISAKAGAKAVETALLYIHTDQLHVPEDLSEAVELLDLATTWQLKRLQRMCESRLCTRIDDSTVCMLLMLAKKYEALAMWERCLEYASQNFANVKEQPSFVELDKHILLDIIQRV